jgi:hypothetical protein
MPSSRHRALGTVIGFVVWPFPETTLATRYRCVHNREDFVYPGCYMFLHGYTAHGTIVSCIFQNAQSQRLIDKAT